MKKTILFDLDGTLIDSTEAILLSFSDVFNEFGIKKASNDEIKKLIGHTLEDMFLSLGVRKSLVDQCVISYKKYYRKRALKLTKLLPQAKEAIILASSFAKLGIVTTKTGKYSKEIFEYMGLINYFEVLIGREDVIHPKPHKEPIEKALKAIGNDKNSSWMIGDTSLDMLSAKNAGIKCVGVLGGYDDKENLIKYADVVLKDVYEAVKFIHNQF